MSSIHVSNVMSKGQLNGRLLRWSLAEIRHGKLWPVALALVLIIACVFALTALATRMEQVVVKQGKDALTADTVLVSGNPIPEQTWERVKALPVTTSLLTRFGTMAFSADDKMQLVTVKAVDSVYPLRGEMRLEGTNGQIVHHVKPGELWLDERLFALLDVQVGQHLSIGDADFTITGRIGEEPGLSFNPFQQMPAVLIHQDDVAKTAAVQMGSRVQYRLFVNGSDSDIAKLKQQVTLTPSDRWRDQSSTSRTSDVFERTQQYLSLAVAIVVIMAATTLVLTCQHYVASRQQTIAMLKSLGASRGWIVRWLAIQTLVLYGTAAILGSLVGVVLEIMLRIPLTDMLPDPLPSYGFAPLGFALLTSLLIAIPALGIPFDRLLMIRPAQVMNESSEKGRKRAWWLVLLPLAVLVYMYQGNTLIWFVLIGIVVLFVLLGITGLLIIKLTNYLPLSPTVKLAISRLQRSGAASTLQFGALSLSLMLLAVMWLVRTDLLTDWQQTLPPDAPNAFAINIAPYEKESYLQTLDAAKVERSPAYPISRGRLTLINGQNAKERANGQEGEDALGRELNFTWGENLPDYNPIVAGVWQAQGAVSVEEDLARDLGIKIGDELTFVINSETFTAKVNTIRHVEWRQMKPNFYFIFSPDVMASVPATWLVSFRLSDKDNPLLVTLSRQHPTVSLIDIRSMGAKIEKLLQQIVWSMTVLAGLGVIAGVLLIFTLLRLSLSQRQQEIQLYRTLGASRKRVIRTIWAEFGLLALVAGWVACIGADAVVGAIMMYGFDMQPKLHIMLWIVLPIATFAILAVVVSSLLRRLLIPLNKAFS